MDGSPWAGALSSGWHTTSGGTRVVWGLQQAPVWGEGCKKPAGGEELAAILDLAEQGPEESPGREVDGVGALEARPKVWPLLLFLQLCLWLAYFSASLN